jgi:hypothetical protein
MTGFLTIFRSYSLFKSKFCDMKRLPVVSRTKPLVGGIPPVISIQDASLNEHLVLPKRYIQNQKYFAIEVLPPNLIDSDDVYIVAGDNHLIMGFLLSSLFPIWVRHTSGKDNGVIDFKTAYNTFPFPEFNTRQEAKILERVSTVYRARGTSSGKQLSDIYCSGDLPEHLEMAHEDLDDAVLEVFGLPPDASTEDIAEKLFSDYRKLFQN